LLQTKHPRNGDKWKDGQAVTETRVFDRVYTFPRTVVASVKGLYPFCADQLHSLEKGTVDLKKTEKTSLEH
jgi:hypothetical protein